MALRRNEWRNCGLFQLIKERIGLKYWLKPVDVKGDKQKNRVKKVNINKLNEKRSFRQCGFRMPI